MTAEPEISASMLSEKSNISMTDGDFFDKLMNTKAVKLLKTKQEVKPKADLSNAISNARPAAKYSKSSVV